VNLDEIERRASRRSDSFADREEFNRHARTDVPALIARVRELEAECERLKTFAAQNFSAMIRQEAEQMRGYGLTFEGVRKVLHEYNDGEISFGKLMDLIRAAARAMAEPTATYSEGETLLRAQAAEAQQLAKQMMDERDELRAECAALRREIAALMDDH
jgi:DNA-binding transcriptional MerR regulator